MPRIGRMPYYPAEGDATVPGIEQRSDTLESRLEHLRGGTREQYESEWVLIKNGDLGPPAEELTHDFTHELGEVPWIVDVLESETSDGKNAVQLQSASSVVITKTETTITLTRSGVSGGIDKYFQVRAM